MTGRPLFLICLVVSLLSALGGCKREVEVRREADEKKLELLREESPLLFDPTLPMESTPEEFIVHIRTNKGGCWIEVHRSWAPNAADQIYRLVQSGYYTMMPFYRVIPNAFVQTGIHLKPEIGAIWRNRIFEPDPLLKQNLEGYAGFAPDPTIDNKLSTQIYVNLRDNFNLDDKGYVPFGRVIKGLGKLRGIYSKYGEIMQEGNSEGPDMSLGWERGIRYFKRNFGNMDMIKSVVISDRPVEQAPKGQTAKDQPDEPDQDEELR